MRKRTYNGPVEALEDLIRMDKQDEFRSAAILVAIPIVGVSLLALVIWLCRHLAVTWV